MFESPGPTTSSPVFDSHDESCLLTMNNNQNRLQEAMAFLITCRGIPIILYGDEQYLHNDTNSGNDRYNRDPRNMICTSVYED